MTAVPIDDGLRTPVVAYRTGDRPDFGIRLMLEVLPLVLEPRQDPFAAADNAVGGVMRRRSRDDGQWMPGRHASLCRLTHLSIGPGRIVNLVHHRSPAPPMLEVVRTVGERPLQETRLQGRYGRALSSD
jgi:hypothetical protein